MKNTYYLLRHGESLKNVNNIASAWPETYYSPLTKRGVVQAKKAGKQLKTKKIDLIFASDVLRAKQTSEIVAKILKLKVIFNKKLREISPGIFNGKLISEVAKFWNKNEGEFNPIKHYKRRFKYAPPKGENYSETERRMKGFLMDMEEKYKNKNILIISHCRPITLLEKAVYKLSQEKIAKIIINKKEIDMAEVRKLRAK